MRRIQEVIDQKRGPVLDWGIQTPRNGRVIVSWSLETLVKHDSRVLDMVSKTIHASSVNKH